MGFGIVVRGSYKPPVLPAPSNKSAPTDVVLYEVKLPNDPITKWAEAEKCVLCQHMRLKAD
jgi:hypothetical protein